MKKNLLLIAMAVTGCIMISSCVSKKELLDCQNSNLTLTNKYQENREALASANARIQSLQEQLNSEKANSASLKKSLKDMQESLNQSLAAANSNNVNVAKLVDQINESNQYIRHLVEVKSKSDSLNMVLTNNLTRSLSKEDMKEVDVQVMKGVVYISLADNMLTDNVPMKGTNIRNNWDLSCLRASSVVQCLQTKYGVDPKRLTAGGRGEFNPIADNNTDAGRATNRRTQIIITPKLDEFMDLIGKAPSDKK